MFTPRIVTSPRLPSQVFPIAIIGTGGIVKDAHLPAYRKAGFPVWGLMNRSLARAEALAKEFGIPRVFGSLEEMVAEAPGDTIYDLALPTSMFADALRKLPDGAFVLIQKPMGESMAPAGAYKIAHHELVVGVDRVVRVPGTSSFAGSALAPDEGVRNIRTWLGLDEDEARRLFSTSIAGAFDVTLPLL